MGVALMAAGLAVSAPARAQHVPLPIGAARMPEPAPDGPSCNTPEPNLIPGPISPMAAPMGPPDCLSLPADHSSAFQCEEFAPECHWYVSLGAQWLQRQRLGAGEVAVRQPPNPRNVLINAVFRDAENAVRTDYRQILRLIGVPSAFANAVGTRLVPDIEALLRVANFAIDRLPTNPLFRNTVRAPAGAEMLLQLNNDVPRMEIGPRGTVGYMWDANAIEYTGYYIIAQDKTVSAMAARHVDALFYNPPPGFENNFLRADQVSLTFGSSFYNNEVNYRRWNIGFPGADVILGVRYVDQHEMLDITGVHNLQSSDPTQNATYEVRTRNQIIAPQVGFEWELPVCCYVSMGFTGKGAWGANVLSSDVTLTRGDGLVAFDTHRTATVFGQVYDVGAFVDFHILERLRLRGGYNALWLTGIAAAPDQIDYNLHGGPPTPPNILPVGTFLQSGLAPAVAAYIQEQLLRMAHQAAALQQVQQAPHGRVNNNGTSFWQGPMVELQFLY
jgi:hypothetical protein